MEGERSRKGKCKTVIAVGGRGLPFRGLDIKISERGGLSRKKQQRRG